MNTASPSPDIDAIERQRADRNAMLAKRLKKRYAAEKRFRILAMLSVFVSVAVLAVLLFAMTSTKLAVT